MTSAQFVHSVDSEAGTDALGQALAGLLPGGALVGLSGPLGAGKTRLVQALAAACGVDRREVVSPTFVLVHEYQGRRPIYHLDAYRLRDDDEFLQLGADEYFRPPNLVLIEWSSRIERCLPEERIDISITVGEGSRRHFEIRGQGPEMADLVGRLQAMLSQ